MTERIDKMEKIYLWGTGERAKQLNLYMADTLKKLNFVGYIDSHKTGSFENKPIFSPNVLREEGVKKIVIIINRFYSEIVKQIEKEYVGESIVVYTEEYLKKVQLINRYKDSRDAEIIDILKYLESNDLGNFNNEFRNKYEQLEVDIHIDEKKELFYMNFNGKRMYLSADYNTKKKAEKYCKSILMEQDEQSPHLYLDADFTVDENAVIIDAGVAEGNFTLAIIDTISKAYLFEPDEKWFEALKYTFEPYKDKVVLINKALSDYVDEDVTTVDNEVNEPINFCKMDIEGEELYALKGAERVIRKSSKLKFAIASYHQEFAYDALCLFMKEHNIPYWCTKGYMYYPESSYRAPILRRGLIRAEKKK